MPVPFFRIYANGVDITGPLSGGEISLTITDGVGMNADTAEIEIDDKDGVIAPPKVGATLRIVAGYIDDYRDFGDYIVDEVSLDGWPQKITISAQSASARSALKQLRPKAYKPPDYRTYGDIFAEIAGRNGLQLSISNEIRSIELDYESQSEEDDASFATRLGDELSAAVSIKNGRLIVVDEGEGASAGGQQLPTIAVIGDVNVLSYNVSRQSKARHKRVKAHWYDRKKKKKEEVEEPAGNDGPDFVIRNPHRSQAKAKRAARAKARRLKRKEASASFEIVGDPHARAEAMVMVTRVRSLVDGAWRATRVNHKWSATSAYSTSLECELPNSGGSASPPVSSKANPKGPNVQQVALPDEAPTPTPSPGGPVTGIGDLPGDGPE